MASHPLPAAAAPAEPLQLPPARGHIPGGVTAPPGWWLSLSPASMQPVDKDCSGKAFTRAGLAQRMFNSVNAAQMDGCLP